MISRRVLGPLVGMMATLSGCSAFNMSPECDKTAVGLARTIAMQGNEKGYDAARVASIVQTSNFSELDSAYNQRSCSAQISVGSLTSMVRYRVRQSEGLHNWYEIEFLDPADPALLAVVARARTMYANPY